MAYVARNKHFGFIDSSGKIVIPLAWQNVSEFDGRVGAYVTDIECIDANGEAQSWISEAEFLGLNGPGVKGLARIEKDDKHGIINRQGEVIIFPVWDRKLLFDEKLMSQVWKDGKCGIVDSGGHVVVPSIWDEIGNYNTMDWAVAKLHRKVGVINRIGEIEIPPEWDDLHAIRSNDFHGWGKNGDPGTPDVIRSLNKNGFGYIDWSGKIIVAPEWQQTEVRTDASSKCYAFIVSRRIEADPQPGWLTSARNWFQRVIGRDESRTILCHLYDIDGHLLWSSDWLSGEFKLLLAVVPAGSVLAFDGFAIWRRRRREQIAAKTSAPPQTFR